MNRITLKLIKMKQMARTLLTVSLFSLLLTGSLQSQTLNEAGEKFNQGIELVKVENHDGAIAAFESCISICDKLGPEGAELRGRAAAQLPELHYKAGVALYKEKKVNEAIVRLEKTIAVADQYGDADTRGKAQKLIPQLHYAVGMAFYKKDEYLKTIESCDKAIAMDPDYAKAYLGKALAMNKLDDTEGMREALRTAIEKGEAGKDEKTVETARELGYKAYLSKGQKAIQASDYKSALSFLGEAASYSDGDANMHYLLAVTHNKLKMWDEAITQAQKAVAGEDSPDKLAAVFFELGTAYEYKGDAANACASYQKALTGPNGAAAKYQMEQVLKCQ